MYTQQNICSGSTAYNSPKLTMNSMPIYSEWIHGGCVCNGILRSNENKWTEISCNNMDKSPKRYVNQEKPDWKEYSVQFHLQRVHKQYGVRNQGRGYFLWEVIDKRVPKRDSGCFPCSASSSSCCLHGPVNLWKFIQFCTFPCAYFISIGRLKIWINQLMNEWGQPKKKRERETQYK